jgi:hypothetical protein
VVRNRLFGRKIDLDAGKLLGIYTGGVLTKLIDIGYQTGLFEAAVKGPASSLRGRSSTSAISANGWARWRQAASSFTTRRAAAIGCRRKHAVSLTGAAARNVSPMSGIIDHFITSAPPPTT